MIRKEPLLLTALMFLACLAPQAVGQDAATSADTGAKDEMSLYPYGNPEWWLRDYPMPAAYHSAAVGRFGYWGTSVEGNPSIIGLYQDLSPSVFWDADGISSDGFSTFDYSLSQFTQEAFKGNLYYYRPGLSTRLDFDRYIHRKEQTPILGFAPETAGWPDAVPVGETFPVMADELILDDDMAVRVEEIDLRFKGQLTKNVRWNFNFYNLHKHGERQVTSTAHCFEATLAANAGTLNTCHLTNQSQHIDWNTAIFEPGLEGHWGPVTVNYSREMKVFSSDDESITRTFNHFGNFQSAPPAGYRDEPMGIGLVPESYTQFDKIKLRADLTDKTSFYAFGYVGDTENQFRDFSRDYWGYDLRLISRLSRGFTMTGYYKQNVQEGGTPPSFLTGQGEPIDNASQIGGIAMSDIRNNMDIDRQQTGIRGAWKPSEYLCYSPLSGVVLTSGYEYSQITRDNVDYLIGGEPFVLPDTHENKMYFDVSKRWNPQWNSFVRYTLRITDDPLIGIRLYDENFPEGNGSTFANTNQPEHVNLVEVGGTWMPAENFVITAQAGIEERVNHSEFANFDEQSYPLTFTAFYAPTCKWTLSAGAGYYTNWIDQDITTGFREEGNVFEAFREPWSYGGRTQLYNVGARYGWSNRLSLHGNVEWLRGVNLFDATTPPGTGLEVAEDVAGIIVEQTRLTGGIDYILSDRVTTFFKYIYSDFEDIDDGYDSGTAHLFLGGLSAVF